MFAGQSLYRSSSRLQSGDVIFPRDKAAVTKSFPQDSHLGATAPGSQSLPPSLHPSFSSPHFRPRPLGVWMLVRVPMYAHGEAMNSGPRVCRDLSNLPALSVLCIQRGTNLKLQKRGFHFSEDFPQCY